MYGISMSSLHFGGKFTLPLRDTQWQPKPRPKTTSRTSLHPVPYRDHLFSRLYPSLSADKILNKPVQEADVQILNDAPAYSAYVDQLNQSNCASGSCSIQLGDTADATKIDFARYAVLALTRSIGGSDFNPYDFGNVGLSYTPTHDHLEVLMHPVPPGNKTAIVLMLIPRLINMTGLTSDRTERRCSQIDDKTTISYTILK